MSISILERRKIFSLCFILKIAVCFKDFNYFSFSISLISVDFASIIIGKLLFLALYAGEMMKFFLLVLVTIILALSLVAARRVRGGSAISGRGGGFPFIHIPHHKSSASTPTNTLFCSALSLLTYISVFLFMEYFPFPF